MADAPRSISNGDNDELLPGARVGDYVIAGKVGEGGMASVYAADHPLIGRRVAIKVLRGDLGTSREAFKRFLQEARAVIAIGHPNIVDVFTFGTLSDGRSFFVMELLEGRTLADALDNDGPLSLHKACDALVEMCDGLEAAHRTGVVHRDLKPQNVFLVAPNGGVKLLDFGIAKLMGRPEPKGPYTRPGMTIGTPDYISPEQARGRDVDPRADVYSLGVVAFEMLTGRLPFVADNGADMMAMHLAAEPEPPSRLRQTLPPAVDSLILRMLAKEPAARPALADIRVELLAIKQQPPAVPVPISRELSALAAEKVELIPPRRLRRFVGGVAAIMTLALGGALVSRGQPLLPSLIALAATPMPAPTFRPVPMPFLQPPSFGILVIRAGAAGTVILVDGEARQLEDGVWRTELTGPHEIVASAPGFRPLSFTVQVDPGRVVEVPVALQPIAKKRPRIAKLPPDDFHTIDPWSKR